LQGVRGADDGSENGAPDDNRCRNKYGHAAGADGRLTGKAVVFVAHDAGRARFSSLKLTSLQLPVFAKMRLAVGFLRA
jgi:hypothetical protein